MGYQESFIFTNHYDVEKNNKDIEEILKIFKKYDVRCADDALASCTHKLHFNENVSGRAGGFKDIKMTFPKGMEMLVVCGERSTQRDVFELFAPDFPQLTNKEISERTDEELELIQRVRICFIENLRFVCEAEKTDKITVEELNLNSEEKGEEE